MVATRSNKNIFSQKFFMNILNGTAIGIVVVLIPTALLSELVKILIPKYPHLEAILTLTRITANTMGIVIGFTIATMFSLQPVHSACVAGAVFLGSGAVQIVDNKMVIVGTGDVINMMVTAMIAIAFIFILGNAFKTYTIIVIPLVVTMGAGFIGYTLYPYVSLVGQYVGNGVAYLLNLTPILMCILMAIVFSIIVVTPATTVGIALAISLSGIGSAAANLGICAAGFGLAVAGWKVNTTGTSLAHFIGSPKLQMANVMKKPKIMLPIICEAAVCGAVGGIIGFQGTPMSAGFGFSGLVGPLNAINLAKNGWSSSYLILVSVGFLVIPLVCAITFNYVFTKVVPIVKPSDYKINI